jgi:hypothetical protein
MEGRTGIYRVMVEKCDRKRPLVTGKDDIKMDLQETGWEVHGLDGSGSRIWICSSEHNNDTLGSVKYGE